MNNSDVLEVLVVWRARAVQGKLKKGKEKYENIAKHSKKIAKHSKA